MLCNTTMDSRHWEVAATTPYVQQIGDAMQRKLRPKADDSC